MTLTIAGSNTFPTRESAPTVQVKETFSGSWKTDHTIVLQSATLVAPALGISSATFSREYGDDVAHPHDASLQDYAPRDLTGWWVRVGFSNGGGTSYTFEGRVEVDTRTIYGVADTPTGDQTWQAYGPAHLLANHKLQGSYWNRSGLVQLGWCPDMNAQDRYGFVTGNRSSSLVNGSYVFESTGTSWTRRQLLDYVLTQHVNAAGGPTWTVGGQADLLDGITDFVPLSGARSAKDAIDMICSRELGISWDVRPSQDGFQVFVFALLAEEIAFGDAVLPSNPMSFTFQAGDDLHHESTTITRTRSQRYSTIRLSGERIVICASLRAADGDLEAKWASSLETTYKGGTGTSGDDPISHDRARQSDDLRSVYTTYGVPTSWSPPPVTVDSGGTVSTEASDYQNDVRKTLTWTPLREGFDYGTNPATDNSPSGHTADFRPPVAYLKNTSGEYVQAESEGFVVAAPSNGLGVVVRGDHAHRLAKNDWSGANCTIVEPEYSYAEMVATVAWESDQRLQLTYTDPDGTDGTVLDLRLPGAHLWYLAPNTVVGLTTSKGLKSSGAGRVLRNDSSRLELAMAGAIARYGRDRYRVEIRLHGYHPVSELIGQILTYVQSDGDAEDVYSPVTSVSWANGMTTVKAGFSL